LLPPFQNGYLCRWRIGQGVKERVILMSREYPQRRYFNARLNELPGYSSPSSRRMSFSSTMTRPGGKPSNCSSVADKGGAAVFFRSSLFGGVGIPKPCHCGSREPRPVRKFLVRRLRHARIRDWVHQHLITNRRPIALFGELRDHRSRVTPNACRDTSD
jgi:hypothetical protein